MHLTQATTTATSVDRTLKQKVQEGMWFSHVLSAVPSVWKIH